MNLLWRIYEARWGRINPHLWGFGVGRDTWRAGNDRRAISGQPISFDETNPFNTAYIVRPDTVLMPSLPVMFFRWEITV